MIGKLKINAKFEKQSNQLKLYL